MKRNLMMRNLKINITDASYSKIQREVERKFLYRMDLDNIVLAFEDADYTKSTLYQIKRFMCFDIRDNSFLSVSVLKSLQK